MKNDTQLLREYNDALAPLYDAATGATTDAWTPPREVASLVLPILKKGMIVLDTGVGTGQSAEPLAEAGAKIVGLDISSVMLETVKKKHPEWDVFQADIAVSDLRSIVTQPVDGVVACGCLEFVADLPAVFGQVTKILKPGGFFCFTFESLIPDHPLQQAASSTLGSGVVDPVPERLMVKVFRRTETEVLTMVREAGFKILETHPFTAYYKGQDKYPVIYQIVLAEKSTR